MTITERPAHITAGRHTADDGLFGPASVTWKVHSDPAMMLVGILAATTQMLHPRVMRMIDQASAFRTNPESRARQTGLYMQTITFADAESARNAGATLRRIHQAVKAVDPETGSTYNAEVPELLLWVQNSLTWAGLRAFKQYGAGKLTDAERDTYVAEQKIAGELLSLDPAVLPSTVGELDAYMAAMLPTLHAIPESVWFRDMMTSRTSVTPKDGKKPRRIDLFIGRMMNDAALERMLPEHRELFGIDIPRRRFWIGKVGARLLLALVRSQVPTGKTIAQMREQVDLQVFGGRRST
ncbi:oxygenase MpaB family protein [Glaciibacter superstes]|uniref:oxygenase MpaB family protein n=1 Tax=Glaciibacter superstes TaxID=501023 RepID=UPI0003B468B8|nr:oxygenase MpaB family protein [Glaciibacter superstes]